MWWPTQIWERSNIIEFLYQGEFGTNRIKNKHKLNLKYLHLDFGTLELLELLELGTSWFNSFDGSLFWRMRHDVLYL